MNEQTKKDIDYCVEYSMRNIKKIEEEDLILEQNTNRVRVLKLEINNGILLVIFFDPVSKKERVCSVFEMENVIKDNIPGIGRRVEPWLNQINTLCFQNQDWNFSILFTITDRPVLKNKTYLCVCSSKLESKAIPIPAIWNIFSFKEKPFFNEKIKKINFIGGVSVGKNFSEIKGIDGQRGSFCSWAQEYEDDMFCKAKIAPSETNKDGFLSSFLGEKFSFDTCTFLEKYPFITDQSFDKEEQSKYLYLLNIEGFSTAWSRFAWQLASNSVSMYLKPVHGPDQHPGSSITENLYYEWYFPLFDKFTLENRQLPTIFVDHTNILQIKKQLDSNPELAKSYIESGKKFYNDYLREEAQLYYLKSVLDRINSLSN